MFAEFIYYRVMGDDNEIVVVFFFPVLGDACNLIALLLLNCPKLTHKEAPSKAKPFLLPTTLAAEGAAFKNFLSIDSLLS
jgi:hypothetical protein